MISLLLLVDLACLIFFISSSVVTCKQNSLLKLSAKDHPPLSFFSTISQVTSWCIWQLVDKESTTMGNFYSYFVRAFISITITETNSSGHHLASFCGMASLEPSSEFCTTSLTIYGWWIIRHFSSSRRLKSIPLVWRSSDFSFRAIVVIIVTRTINDIPCCFFQNDVLPALWWK